MNSFYSKNKRDQNADLTKIEQKRYEEILIQERNKRKSMINSVRSSLEEKKFVRSIKDSLKIPSTIDSSVKSEKGMNHHSDLSLKNLDQEKISIEKEIIDDENGSKGKKNQDLQNDCGKPEENAKHMLKESSTPKYRNYNLKVSKKSYEEGSEKLSSPIIDKPSTSISMITKAKSMKEQNKKEIGNLKNELNSLEEEEAFLIASLQKIDVQNYKKKLSAHLQTINEETKEMEDSLARVLQFSEKPTNFVESPKKAGKKISNLQIISENSIKIHPKSPSHSENTETSAVIAEKQHKFPLALVKTSEKKIPTEENENISTNSPESASFLPKKLLKIPVRSIYSDHGKKSKKYHRSTDSKSNEPKNKRIVSKDYVRVNPNIDIKSLLYS